MNNYVVKYGETISDVALNSTGSILAWETILQLNNFTEWVPDLKVGQSLIVPDPIDLVFLNELNIYPACNRTEIIDLESQITTLINILSVVTPISQSLSISQQNKTNIYIVQLGETITDIVLNSTGSILNWDAVLKINNFNEWVPTLRAGQEIIIPDVELQNNVLEILKLYPACNSNEINDLNEQMQALINYFTDANKYLFDDDNEEYLFDDDNVNFLFND